MPDTKYRHIAITGASSGIGAALAREFAQTGVMLTLGGRDSARLEAVAAQCRELGADARTALVDVGDRQAMSAWLHGADDKLPLDLVVANAGISAGTSGVMHGEDPLQVRRLFDINLNGVLNTVEPVLPRMIRRKSGHVALMSSLAGFRGWPGAPAYCASKAAVRVYGEGLRGALSRAQVRVSVICPGFVESPMTAVNDFPMPFRIPAARAAAIIRRGLERNHGRIAFPRRAFAAAWFLALLPDSLAQKILKELPAKKAAN